MSKSSSSFVVEIKSVTSEPNRFAEDENRHNKPTLPVTKEAVAIIRQRMKALDARPIKKVAEAKFRKQIRTQKRMEKMLKKTEALNEDEDSTEKSKLMSIAKLVKKAKAKPKEKKVQVVVARGANRGNQGRPKGVKGRYKVSTFSGCVFFGGWSSVLTCWCLQMVDPRMRKEIRAQKRIAAKKGKKRK